MNRILKTSLVAAATVVLLAGTGAAWYLHGKQPQRSGSVALAL